MWPSLELVAVNEKANHNYSCQIYPAAGHGHGCVGPVDVGGV